MGLLVLWQSGSSAGKEFFDHPLYLFEGLRPYGQPGQKPEMATLLPYWLSEGSNFISWLLNSRVRRPHITLVKQSIRVVKVIPCYIDSTF